MCRCLPGFQLLPIQRACIDVDECKANPCGQGALCENSIGSFRCKCPAGTSGDPSRQCVPTGALVVKCSSDSQVKQSLTEIMLWLCNFLHLASLNVFMSSTKSEGKGLTNLTLKCLAVQTGRDLRQRRLRLPSGLRPQPCHRRLRGHQRVSDHRQARVWS